MSRSLDTDAFEALAATLRAAEAAHTSAEAAFNAARRNLESRAKVMNETKQALRMLVETAAGARVWP